MRITVAGLGLVRQQQRTADGPVRLPTDGQPFGDNLWNQPGQKVLPAKRLLAHMGVAHIITLLEDFCVGLKGEHDRFTAGSGHSAGRHNADEAEANGLSPKSLYTQLRLRKDTLNRVEPLYEYFVKVRNCVIHRSGRASSELHRYASQPKLRACVEGWEGPRAARIPALPAIILGEEIALLPRHAILASEVCRIIARDANRQLVDFLGENGMISMAAHHSLLAENRIRTAARNSPQAILNYLTTDRYRIGLASTDEAVRVLSRIGRWKPYLRRFERLKAEGKLARP
jgi:hypothetical protein